MMTTMIRYRQVIFGRFLCANLTSNSILHFAIYSHTDINKKPKQVKQVVNCKEMYVAKSTVNLCPRDLVIDDEILLYVGILGFLPKFC